MRILFTIPALIVSTFAIAQTSSLGVINDPDGYTNFRAGRGTEFDIVGKITENEVFVFYDTANTDWLKVAITRGRYNEPGNMYFEQSGYMHQSRIINIDELNIGRKRQLFNSIFEVEKELYQKMLDSRNMDSEERKRAGADMYMHHDYQFVSILNAFERYVCQQKDRTLFDKFLDILLIEKGSADEMPSYALGAIFMCDPDWTFESMKSHERLLGLLEWGIINIGYDGLKEKSLQLFKKYNELRVSIGLPESKISDYDQ